MKHKSEDYKLSAVEKYNTYGEIKRYNKKPVAYKITKDQVKDALKAMLEILNKSINEYKYLH